MIDDRDTHKPAITEGFNQSVNPQLDPTSDFNQAAGVEPSMRPPSAPKKVMALTPGGTLEQIVHSVVASRDPISPQLRDEDDPRSIKAQAGREQVYRQEQEQVKEQSEYQTVPHNKYVWDYHNEPGMKGAYKLSDDHGDAMVFVVPVDKNRPFEEGNGGQLQSKEFQSGEWTVDPGDYTLKEAMDRGEACADQFFSQEITAKHQKRMQQRSTNRDNQKDRGGRER